MSKDKDKYQEILNDATKSRFSEFGYSNDAEVDDHYNKTHNYIKNRPLRVNNEGLKNKYDVGGLNIGVFKQLQINEIAIKNLMSLSNNIGNIVQIQGGGNLVNEGVNLQNDSSLNAFRYFNNENERKWVLSTKF